MPRLLFLCALLAGCASTIDLSRAPPADWPALVIEYRYVTTSDVAIRCYHTANPIGCAAPDFNNGVCRLWLATREARVLAHEEAHCLGYDHPNENTMRDAWQTWKERNGRH